MSEWISVEQQEPEDGQLCLVCCAGYDLVDIGKFKRFSDTGTSRFTYTNWLRARRVTHWMPLPAPLGKEAAETEPEEGG